MAHGGERKAVVAALFANSGIAIAKFIGFAMTGAASLLAEAIHSVADTSNQALSTRTAVRAARAVKDPDVSWREWIRTSKSAELPVVVLEDIGALVGLVIALAGIVGSKVTDEPRFDALGSLGIGLLLVVIALVLAREMRSLLIGEAAGPKDIHTVEAVIRADPRVMRIVDFRTQQLGPQELLVGVELELDPALNGVELADALEEIERAVRAAVPAARQIYLEPHTAR